MTIWGVDLGVRSAYAVGLAESDVRISKLVLKRGEHSRSDELRLLHEWAIGLAGPMYVEEPPLAGARNVRTFLGLAQVSGAICSVGAAELVPVSSWKLRVVGNGSASKDDVSRLFSKLDPVSYRACGGDQNLIDAACLATYGVTEVFGAAYARRRRRGR